jgi:hypothetical protein
MLLTSYWYWHGRDSGISKGSATASMAHTPQCTHLLNKRSPPPHTHARVTGDELKEAQAAAREAAKDARDVARDNAAALKQVAAAEAAIADAERDSQQVWRQWVIGAVHAAGDGWGGVVGA